MLEVSSNMALSCGNSDALLDKSLIAIFSSVELYEFELDDPESLLLLDDEEEDELLELDDACSTVRDSFTLDLVVPPCSLRSGSDDLERRVLKLFTLLTLIFLSSLVVAVCFDLSFSDCGGS